MSTTERLPRLMDKKSIAAELNVPLPTAAQIMRHVPKVKVGRRVFEHEWCGCGWHGEGEAGGK